MINHFSSVKTSTNQINTNAQTCQNLNQYILTYIFVQKAKYLYLYYYISIFEYDKNGVVAKAYYELSKEVLHDERQEVKNEPSISR